MRIKHVCFYDIDQRSIMRCLSFLKARRAIKIDRIARDGRSKWSKLIDISSGASVADSCYENNDLAMTSRHDYTYFAGRKKRIQDRFRDSLVTAYSSGLYLSRSTNESTLMRESDLKQLERADATTDLPSRARSRVTRGYFYCRRVMRIKRKVGRLQSPDVWRCVFLDN